MLVEFTKYIVHFLFSAFDEVQSVKSYGNALIRCMEQAGVSQNEMGIRQCLFWPDGTRKKRTKSYIFKKGHEHISRLVCAIVDQYNEDHNLLGVCSLSFTCLYAASRIALHRVHITLAYLTCASYFRILHTNSKTW